MGSLEEFISQNRQRVIQEMETDDLAGATEVQKTTDGEYQDPAPIIVHEEGQPIPINNDDLEGAIEVPENPLGTGEPTIRQFQEQEVPDAPKEFSYPKYIEQKYKKGKVPFIKAAYAYDFMTGKITLDQMLTEGNAEHLKELESINKLEDVKFGDRTVAFFLGEAAQLLPFMIDTALESAKWALLGGSVGTVAGFLAGGLAAPAGAVAGAKVGGVYGVMKNSLDIEGMNILFDLLEAGIPKETAIPLAIAGGVAIGVTEVFQLRLFGAGFRKIVVKALQDKYAKKALVAGAVLWAKNTGIQTGQEAVQSMIELSTKFLASVIEKNPNVMPTRGDLVNEMVGVLKGAAGMFVLGAPSAGAAAVQVRMLNAKEAMELANEKFTKEQAEKTIEIQFEGGVIEKVPASQVEITEVEKLKRGVKAFAKEDEISQSTLGETLPTEHIKQQKIGSKDIGKQDEIEAEDVLPDGGTLKLKRKDLVGRVNKLTEDIKKNINPRLDAILTEVSKTKDPLATKRLHNETLKLLEKRDALQKEIVALSAVENRAARQLGVKKVLLSAKEVVALEEAVIKAKTKAIVRGINSGRKMMAAEIKDVQAQYAGFVMRSFADEKSKLAVMKDMMKVQNVKQFLDTRFKNEKRLRQATERLQKKALIKNLKQMTKPKKLAKVSSEFLPNIEAILKPFSLTTPTKETTAKLVWLAKALRETANNQITAEQLRVLEKLDKKPLTKMGVKEVELVHDSVAHLLKLNTEKQKLNKENRTAQQEKNLDEAIKNVSEKFEEADGSVSGLDDMQAGVETEIFKFDTGLFKDLLGVISWNTELIGEILDGKDDGIIMKVMYNAIDDGHAVAINYRTDVQKFFDDNGMKGLVKKGWSLGFNRFKRSVTQHSVKLDNYKDPLKLNTGRRISIMLLSRNEKSRKHLTEGGFNFDNSKEANVVKLTEADIDRIIDSASKDELQVADIIHQFFNTMQKDKINEVTEDLLGFSVAIEENYFPSHVAKKALVQEAESVGLSKQDAFMKTTLEGMGMFKAKKGTSEPLIISDAFDVVTNQVRSVSNFVGLAKPLRDSKALLHAPEFRTAVTNAGRGKYLTSMEDYLDKIEGSIYNNDKIGRLAQHWQSRIDVAVLAGNIGVWLKQPVSYMLAASEIDSKYLRFSFSPKASQKLVDTMKKWSPQARERFDGNITLETGDIAGVSASNKLFRGKQSLSNTAMTMIHKFDKAAITSIWRGVEKETKAEHTNLKVGSDAYYEHVAARWWKIVRRTQPTFDMKDRSYGGRNTNTWWRLMTKYTSQRNKNWIIQRRAFEKFNRSDGHTYSDWKKVIKTTLLIRLVTPAMIAGINITRSMMKEEEPDKKELSFFQRYVLDWVRTTLGDVFLLSPMLGGLIEKFEKKGKGFGLTDPLTRNFELMIDWSYQFIDAAAGLVNGGNTISGKVRTKKQQQAWNKRFYRNTLDLTSKLTGIPVKGVTDTLKLPLQATGLVDKQGSNRKYRRRKY